MNRANILQAASNCVCTDRNQQYGEPEDNFRLIACLWADYLHGCGLNIDFLEPQDVANMMILFKVGRAATADSPTLDTYIDIAGYAACGGEIASKAKEATTNAV